MESVHHCSSRPDCNSTGTALSANPLVSDLCGVDVHWFQENSSHSSQDLPNSMELSVRMTFGFLVGSKNFCKLFSVSEKSLFHTDRIVTTALPSLVPLQRIDDCSAIHILHCELCDPQLLKHQKLSALGTTVPVRLLQEALVIMVLKQMSQFRSFGKWVWILCWPKCLPIKFWGIKPVKIYLKQWPSEK